jgi:hypothetical protein
MPLQNSSSQYNVAAPRRRTHRPRPLPDLAALPAHAVITRRQFCELVSVALPTAKLWAKQGRGPKVTCIEGRPRYLAGDVREWLAQSAQSA